MSAVAQQVMTAEAFWQMQETDLQRDLIRGEMIERMPPGGQHGAIASELNAQLRTWAKTGAKGCVGVESGFILARNPDTVRSPDIFYVRADRIPETGIPEGFWELAPDLAVEVVSPSESAADVRDKVRDYLAAGTQLMWVIYPRSREVIVHTPDGLAKTYSQHDELTGAEVLPNFMCVVASLFE
ncbi:MAG: Uma2 family endonuclease [Herpetosiphonaceae bacterium]|nr:Uma2 family endonuclease [Herpetosiphonaceae bacterium]